MYLFGSTLIKKYFNDFRSPNDIDWVSNNEDEIKNKIPIKGEEYYFIPFSPNREMTPDELYTLKFSHAIYDIHWKKTMSDIRFLKMKGCKIIPTLLEELRAFWEKIHGEQKRTDFEVKPGKFFEDRVIRKTNHDDLHKIINSSPTYLKIVEDGQVKPSFDKYLLLDDIDRKELLFEEAFVISLERFKKGTERVTYQMAQQILVTRLHPIWISDIIIENWNKWYWNPSNSKFFEQYLKIKNNKII